MSSDRKARGSAAREAPGSTGVRNAPGALRVRCWGTRGSLPSPGAETAGYGGNTSCVEICLPDRCLILDAGSGIRCLGEQLARVGSAVDAELFLTHFHWDHIQGLPFFAPLYDARTRLRVHGAAQGGVDMRTLLAGQMGPTYFPIPYDALAAQLEFAHWEGEPWSAGGVEVAAFPARHAGQTLGYRVRAPMGTVCYFPDNELVGGPHQVPVDWRARLVEFVHGADLLIHDAMYTDAEYVHHQGWGHSTAAQAVTLAEESGVKRLQLFHHAPGRTDASIDSAVLSLRADLERRGSTLRVGAAREGVDLAIAGAGS